MVVQLTTHVAAAAAGDWNKEEEESMKKIKEDVKKWLKDPSKVLSGVETASGIIKDIINGADVGTLVEKLADIVGCGFLVSLLISTSDETTSPVYEKLDELSKQIDALSRKMTNEFNDLKAFITESRFDGEITSVSDILTRFMRDTVKNPSETGKTLFLEEYNKQKPLTAAYKLMHYLGTDTSNPLKMSLDAENMKTKSTFAKWENKLLAVMGQFLLLESYASGLLDQDTIYSSMRLKEAIAEMRTSIAGWKVEYLKHDYWPFMKELIEKTQDEEKDVAYGDKGALLKTALEDVLTNDAFYIYIAHPDEKPSGIDFDPVPITMIKEAKDQSVWSKDRADCTIMVYRSFKANLVPQTNLDDFSKQVQSFKKDGGTPCDENGNDARNRLAKAGMIMFVPMYFESHYKWANTTQPWGPGWFVYDGMLKQMGTDPFAGYVPTQHTLFAGYE